MGKIKCMKCLGSGQQFTRALAAKEECSSFPDSDPRSQKEPQQQREQGCFFTCCKSRRSESHSLHLWLKPETASAAKGSGGGARRHCLARKSRPHSGTEWQATHDGRRCLAHYPKKKKKKKSLGFSLPTDTDRKQGERPRRRGEWIRNKKIPTITCHYGRKKMGERAQDTRNILMRL